MFHEMIFIASPNSGFLWLLSGVELSVQRCDLADE